MGPRDLPYQPVIRGALAMSGYAPEDVLAKPHWVNRSSPFMTSASRMDLPFILFDSYSGTIDWGRNGVELRFQRKMNAQNQEYYAFTMYVQTTVLPDSVLVTITGRPLSFLVDIEGADSFTIAGFERTDEDKGYLFSLTPVDASTITETKD